MNTPQRRRAPIDEVQELTRAIVSRNVVLSRFFELHANAAHADLSLVDFGCFREVDFWYGLRQMVDDSVAAAERISELSDALTEKSDGPS